ncbi:Retrovirus-related Pol polyprotein from transposon 17.6 [Nosema granulosis]|uniref:Retrovirus-related Pol polyprotein from transposon 17.6 n=1 Tax=Nosema granulosis TaxID=83296 RepID=A0A9P6KXK2_9MICR|nr:Retrovirus-related Pol polyprotein from transposon 17.6 [Nosema granulosis]
MSYLTKKCKFMRTEVKILGNIITESKVKPDPEKIECIRNYPLLRNIKELRSFLGQTNYCRDFIKKFSKITKGLYDLLKGENKRSVKTITHTEDSLAAFHKIRSARQKKLHEHNLISKKISF